MKYLYVAAGQNDNIKNAYVTKENYRKIKNAILHPDYDPVSYLKVFDKFLKANANKTLILDLKCYLKNYIDKLIAEKLVENNSTGQLFNDLDNDPMEFSNNIHKIANLSMEQIENLMPFRKNISNKLFKINLDCYKRANFTLDNDIALVELEQPFEFGIDVLPSCLLENDKKQFDNSFIRKSF